MSPQPNRTYADLNLSFLPTPVKKDVSTLKDEAAVKRSVRNLILTNNYERFFQPDLGSGVTGLLFEPFSRITERSIEQRVRSVIQSYESRAEVLDVSVQIDPSHNGYNCTITFMVVNLKEPITVDVFLERIP